MTTVPAVGETLGRYRIVEQIGQGGMGVVFRAFDDQLQRHVALKFTSGIVDESRRKRFRDEALALARLNHPHIGVIHGFETIAGVDVLVMEYISGRTLGQHIGGKPLPEPEVIALGLQLAGALREAHAGGVIHRDLKPANILITADGDAKVLDFGLALLRSENSPTQSAVKLEGTVQYIAPEVLRGGIPDERSDVYSLGAVLYEMATGRPPHASESFAQLVESILYKTPVPPELIVPSLSASLVAIIKHALANVPTNRYQSAAEIRADLVSLQSGSVLDIPRIFAPHRRWLRAAFAIGLSFVALLLLWIGSKVRLTHLLPQRKVIAVLPFEPIGEAPENRALSRGLTELITVRLAQASQRYGFEVVPSSEIRAQEITSADQARKKLGASLVVEGSWDFSTQQRIMYALVDADNHRNLNAAVVRADTGDVYAAENTVLQELLVMLDVEFGQIPPTEPAQPEAYQSFVRGRGFLWDYQNADSLQRAIALFKSAIDADPQFAEAYASLGEAYWRKYEDTRDSKYVELAIGACNRAASLNRNISEVHSTLGLIYRGTGKQADAVKSFREALRLDPNNDTASRGLAASYESLGDFAKAEATYRQAIAARPDYWGGYHDLGVFFYRRGQLDAAAGEFQREIQLAPDNVRAYTDLGGIYYLQNRFDEARGLFLKSIDLQPNYRAYSNLGTMDFFERKYADAAANFEQALKFSDADGRVWRNLAWSYYWAGSQAKAATAFRHAEKTFEDQLKINPKDTATMIALADCYSVTGENGQAESLLAKALPSATDAESAFRAVEIYEKLGKRDQALAWLQTAINRGYVLAEIEKDPSLSALRKDPRYSSSVYKTK
jgi:tetratricopeptide (TPR) repeat protein/TolB-like protein/predicted Ser/Thr protein kinase